ncbi:MAG: acyltransferase [Halioglobus sp.]
MNNTSPHIPALDALRGLACLLVVLSHAGGLGVFYDIRGAGQIGVMLFFSLSGFLMYLLYGERPTNRDILTEYTIRRFFRIVPAFVFIVLASYLGYLSGWFELYAIDNQELWLHLTLRGEVSVLWTIAVELQFYLFFPLILILFSRMEHGSHKIIILTLSYALFIALEFDLPKSYLWRFIEFFLGGMIAAAVYRSVRPGAAYSVFINIAFVLALAMLVVSIPRFIDPLLNVQAGLWRDPLPYSLLVGAAVLLAAWCSGRTASTFANPALNFMGKISFSLYLIHLPTMKFVLAALDASKLVECTVAIACSVVLAYLMYLVVEKPGQKLGRSILHRLR